MRQFTGRDVVAKGVALLALVFGAFLFFSWWKAPADVPQSEVTAPLGWIESAPTSQGIVYSYPEDLKTNYIREVSWPPRVEVVVNEYSCSVVGGSDGPQSVVEERSIGGRNYCVSQTMEGAAGSSYITYEYSTDRGDAVMRTFFTLQFVQCANYDEQERNTCSDEQGDFDADFLAHELIQSAKLPE